MKRAMIISATVVSAALPVMSAAPAATAASVNARPAVEQSGTGVWTSTSSGVGFTGTTTGRPVAGTTRGFVQTRDGSLPGTLHTCEDGSGTLSTWSDKATLTLTLTGDICLEAFPEGNITVLAYYDVASYGGSRIKPGATGRGQVSIVFATDGTATWTVTGDLHSSLRPGLSARSE